MLTVHLIVNVFNGEKYLAETLESLVLQDYPKVLIHCIDNHSTDKTAEIISEFKSKYANVMSWLPPTHMPLVDARLFALSEITKTQEMPFYFGFCDADDLSTPDWASKLMAFADLNYDILTCNGYTFDENKKYTPVDSCLSQWRPTPFGCPVFLRSVLFSSENLKDGTALLDNNFPIIYDTEFWLRRGNDLSCLHISDRLFYKRIHSDSMLLNNFFPVLLERWGMLKKHNLPLSRFLYGLFRQLLNMVFRP